MLQTAANTLPQAQYLQITDEQPAVIAGVSPATENGSGIAITNRLFDKVAPFYYKSRVRLSFSLAEEFKANFILIKGLLEFNRTNRFSFQYNAEQKNIETDISVNQLHELQSFLDKVFILLNQEVQFKRTLKVVLEFESRYKLASAELYASLKNM